MTPDRQALERAARAYLAACDVESIDSETWYRAVVDARDALRAALDAEATEPAPKPEGCPTCGLTDPTHHPCDANGTACPCFDDFHREQAVRECDEPGCGAHGLTKSRVWRCAIHHPEHPANATPPTTAEGRGEEAERAYAKTFGEILARDICESEPSGVVIEAQDRLQGTDAATFLVIEPKVLAEFVARNVDNAFHDGEIVLRSLPHGDGGGKEAS